MFDINFKINGKKVHPNRIGEELEKAVSKQARDKLARDIKRVRDPKTGETPRVKVNGTRLSNLTVEVSGSEAIVEKVKETLK